MTPHHPVDLWLASQRQPLPSWIHDRGSPTDDTRAFATEDGVDVFARAGTVGSHRFLALVVTGLPGTVGSYTLAAIREAFFVPGRGVELRSPETSVDVVQLWQVVDGGS